MPLEYVTGDPILTDAQVLAIGHNARGRTELSDLHTRLTQTYTTAYAMYSRQARKGKATSGTYWLWREAKPMLMFMTIRDSSVGATRLRYVQSAVINLARDYRLEALQSVAIAPLGQSHEWAEIKLILEQWLGPSKLPVVVYDTVQVGVKVAEPWSAGLG